MMRKEERWGVGVWEGGRALGGWILLCDGLLAVGGEGVARMGRDR